MEFFLNLPLTTGFAILFCLSLMPLLKLIKLVPNLNFAKAQVFAKLHIVIGVIILGLVYTHSGFNFVTSPLNFLLLTLFCLTALSGIFGFMVIKILPKQLAGTMEEIAYENIDRYVYSLQQSSEELIMQARDLQMHSLINFYLSDLHQFFSKKQDFWAHLVNNKQKQYYYKNELNNIKRLQNDSQIKVINRMLHLVLQKHNLDYHYALQTVLKYWNFIHAPISYGLIIVVIVHVFTVFAYS